MKWASSKEGLDTFSFCIVQIMLPFETVESVLGLWRNCTFWRGGLGWPEACCENSHHQIYSHEIYLKYQERSKINERTDAEVTQMASICCMKSSVSPRVHTITPGTKGKLRAFKQPYFNISYCTLNFFQTPKKSSSGFMVGHFLIVHN